ncbi:MAG: hypothetical protein CL846_05890 [Crocinitomicaceae bacterium]|nr:hypothetical protein [Crocinitomicaceae bacterium]
MKKIIYIASLLLFYNCSNPLTEKSSQIIIDPNPTSEMAQLMRDMTLKLEGIKTAIENNEVLDENQLDFALIHNQKPTDSSFVKPHIKPMSENFAYSIEQFNKEPSSRNYSTIINNCLSCHQLSCPGPVVRINQLKLNH